MKKVERQEKKVEKTKDAQQPRVDFSKATFQIFNSHEEMDEYTAQQRAKMTYDERMRNLERLRKIVFSEHLLPDGSWPPMEQTFKIMPPYTNDIGD